MEAALALAGPLLALAREQQGQEQQLEDQEGQLLEAEGPLVAAGPGKHGDEEEDDGESSHRPAALDRRALLRRRLYALGDEEAHSLARLLEAQLLAPPPSSSEAAPGDPSQTQQQQQQQQQQQSQLPPTANDLLAVLLAAPRTALPAIGACVGLVAQGRLSGRQAVLCASAIREALSTELAVAVIVGGNEAEEEDADEQEEDDDEGALEQGEEDGTNGSHGDNASACKRRRGRRRARGEHHHNASRPQIPTEAELCRRAALLAELRALLFAAVDALLPAPAKGEEEKGDRRLRLRLAEAGPGRLNDFALVIDVLWPLLVLAQRLEDALRLWAAAAARRRLQQQQQHKARRRRSGERQDGADGGLEGCAEMEGGDSSSQGAAVWEPPAASIGEEVAAAVVARPWPAPLTLPLLGLCRDMHEFLAEGEEEGWSGGGIMEGPTPPIPTPTATWALVRRQIRRNACCRPGPTASSSSSSSLGVPGCGAPSSCEGAAADKLLASDGAGLMRQCLLLAEAHARRAHATTLAAGVGGGGSGAGGAACAARRSSSAPAAARPVASSHRNPWLALFRRLYHATPSEALATTELVLEQCLRQALPCVGLLARDLEARLVRQQHPQPAQGGAKEGRAAADLEEEAAADADVCWRDVALLLLLRRTVASWPLSSLLASAAAVSAGGSGSGGGGRRRRAQGGGNGALDVVCSHPLLDGLILACLLRLAARAAAAAASSTASGPEPAASTSKQQQAAAFAAPSLPRLLAGARRAVGAVVTHVAAGGLLENDAGGVDAPYYQPHHDQQQRRRRLCLGRLALQRSSQLFEASLAWLRDAERACLDLDRQFPAAGAAAPPRLHAGELRALAAAAISALYGAVPEGQARVLGALLGAIVEHSAGQPEHTPSQAPPLAAGDDAGHPARLALSPAGAGLVRALGAVTAEWPATLRQHTGVFQHLVAQLPTLPSPLACAVVRASAPLAAACPAYLDALLAVVRKCIVRADVSGRAFGMAALTALLAVSSTGGPTRGGGGGMGMGLLARADRGEEVAAMFESLLGLALPLPLKARLYRAIAAAAAAASAPARGCFGGGSSFSSSSCSAAASSVSGMHVPTGGSGSVAVSLLRASMGRRLARFVDRDTGRLSPLSLFEECRRGGAGAAAAAGVNGGAPSTSSSSSAVVALRDDLPELLRCVLSLSSQHHHAGPATSSRDGIDKKAPAPLSVRLARLVLGGGAEDEEGDVDPDAAWARRALDGVVAFLRDGAPMEGSASGQGADEEEEEDEGMEFGGFVYGGRHGKRRGPGRWRRRKNGSVLPPCCPDSVSAGEKLHLLLALLEALLDATLSFSTPGHNDDDAAAEGAYQAAMELYRLHGMLSDMAEALGVKPRAQRPAVDGVERGAPLLRLEGAAAFLRLVWARVGPRGAKTGLGADGDDDEGPEAEEEEAVVATCAACGEARRRFALWAVQHAALSCQRALVAAGSAAAAGEEQQLPADAGSVAPTAAAASSSAAAAVAETPAVDAAPTVVSPAALLPVLLGLYARVPTAFAGPADGAADLAVMDEEKAEGADPAGSGCLRCHGVQRVAALKQQATTLAAAPADGAASSSSKLRRRAPALAAQVAWQRAAAALPLSAAFLAGVDGKARRLVDEEVAASAADPGAAVLEARVALLDLIRAVVARLGGGGSSSHAASSLLLVPPSPPSAVDAGGEAAAATEASTAAAAGAGLGLLLPFVDTLVAELGGGLAGEEGMPVRLVQAYLDLLEALVARLPPCFPPGAHRASTKDGGDALVIEEAYAAWRLALARRLLLPLTRARVSQAPVLRRFVRLALAAAPAAGTVALTDGVMAAGARYLGEWLREARNAYLRRRRGGGGGKGDEEVVTAAEARELLEEEGDGELYPDGAEDEDEGGGSDDVDPAAARADEAMEGAQGGKPDHGKEGAAGVQANDEDAEEDDLLDGGDDDKAAASNKALARELGRMRFASAACWQAAILPVLARWEQLLLLQNPPALDRKGFAALLGHLPTFLRPLDVGGQSSIYSSAGPASSSPGATHASMSLATALLRSGSSTGHSRGQGKGGKKKAKDHKQLRVAAFFLPGPVKLRLLGLFSRLFALARPAAARVARRLRRLHRRAVAEEDGDDDDDDNDNDAGEDAAGGPRPAWDADVALVRAYLPWATDLSVAVQAWAAAERQQRGGASAALRKRLPSALFALERVDLAVQRLARQATEHGASLGADWLLPVEEGDEGGGKRRKGKGGKGKGAVEGEKAALCPLAARLVRWHHERRRWEEAMEKENRAPSSSSSSSRRRRQQQHGAEDEESLGSGSGSGSNSSEEEEDEDDYDLALLTMGGGGRGGRGHKRKRGRRLRSRNVVVDRWLAEEGDEDDAFADLEDFIMEDEYT